MGHHARKRFHVHDHVLELYYFKISTKDFIKNYDEEIDEGQFLQIDVQYLEQLHGIYNDLSFSPERMKIENVEKLVASLHDKSKYVIHIRNLRQALNKKTQQLFKSDVFVEEINQISLSSNDDKRMQPIHLI